MRFKNTGFNLLIFTALLLVASWPATLSAQGMETAGAVDDPALSANYRFYTSGLSVIDSTLRLEQPDEGRYEISFDAVTRGLLGKLVRWRGLFETRGWLENGEYLPEQHRSVEIAWGETETKTYSYNRDGSFESYRIQEHEKPEEVKTPARELTQNTTDILSASAQMMRSIEETGSCDYSGEIFDGKRRYRLIIRQVGKTMLESSRYNIYNGPAIECTALVEPLAGEWHEKPRGWASIQEQGRRLGSLPTIWFANRADMPAIPVKARVKTDYGTLFMHLTE